MRMDNIYLKFCLYHGVTPHYKNGKCKECVKYQRLEARRKNKEFKDHIDKYYKIYLPKGMRKN
jgi:hypothetical protein